MKKTSKPRDTNSNAFAVVAEATSRHDAPAKDVIRLKLIDFKPTPVASVKGMVRRQRTDQPDISQ